MLVCRSSLTARCVPRTLNVRVYHSSPALTVGRDFNTYMPEDTRTTIKGIRSKIFKDTGKWTVGEKPLPRPQNVAFVPPLMEDEVARAIPPVVPEFEHFSTLPMPPQDNEKVKLPKPAFPNVAPTGTVIGNGKRKTSRAGVAVFTPGTGQITINGKHWMDYFPHIFVRSTMLEPILASEKFNKVDIKCMVKGGGFMGQAGAIKNALANALVNGDPEYRFLMKSADMLIPDHRQKERKHTGLRKARRRQQWVKR